MRSFLLCSILFSLFLHLSLSRSNGSPSLPAVAAGLPRQFAQKAPPGTEIGGGGGTRGTYPPPRTLGQGKFSSEAPKISFFPEVVPPPHGQKIPSEKCKKPAEYPPPRTPRKPNGTPPKLKSYHRPWAPPLTFEDDDGASTDDGSSSLSSSSSSSSDAEDEEREEEGENMAPGGRSIYKRKWKKEGRVAADDDTAAGDADEGNIWAVLVAGSNGWINYRHQADVCHAYHTLVNHGVAKERIITMMFDDIANNKYNPYKGKIFNEPGGKDVYAGVKIDYSGPEVNPENFEAILLGDEQRSEGKPVLKSTKKDKVFVYFSDHGAVGMICFPNDDFTVKQLTQTLKGMHEKQMYGELTFYLETCESGSMFDHTLAKSLKIYAVTAANGQESSWGCFCDTQFLPGNCLGDLFSVNWMQDSDQENLRTETLRTQFGIVRQETNRSHVMHYGDLVIQEEHVSEFMGKKEHTHRGNGDTPLASPHHFPMFPSRDIPLFMMARRQNESQLIRHNLRVAWKKRGILEQLIKRIVHKLVHDTNNRRHIFTTFPQQIRELDCHHEVVHTFSNFCLKFSENPYALKYVNVLANLCERPELDTERIKMTMIEQCADVVELHGVI